MVQIEHTLIPLYDSSNVTTSKSTIISDSYSNHYAKNKEQNWKVLGQFIQKSSFPAQFLLSATERSMLHPFSKIKYLLSPTGVQLLKDALHDVVNEVFKTLDQSYSSLFELELSTIMDQKGAIWLMYVNTMPSYDVYTRYNDELAEQIFHGPLKFSRFTP